MGPFAKREPTDPPAAGMRQLTYIAAVYAPACAGASAAGAGTLVVGVIAVTGLLHAALANWHGIKRGEQDAAVRQAEAQAARTPHPRPPPPVESSTQGGDTPGPSRASHRLRATARRLATRPRAIRNRGDGSIASEARREPERSTRSGEQ